MNTIFLLGKRWKRKTERQNVSLNFGNNYILRFREGTIFKAFSRRNNFESCVDLERFLEGIIVLN